MIVSSEAFLATEPAPRASRTSYFSLIIVGSLVFASARSLAAHPVVVQPSRPNRKNKLKIVASYKTLGNSAKYLFLQHAPSISKIIIARVIFLTAAVI